MFNLNDSLHYYLCSHAVDMRGGFDRLCGIVKTRMGRDPLSGEVFVFINRSRTRIKLLHMERGGLVLYHKRLEYGRISIPKLDPVTGSYHLSWCKLMLMVEGVDLNRTTPKKRYEIPSKTA
ncbi:MAG: IS66 family insertion sequence element accessory protein TnpB [Proteiniphilum sp.]|uniref:IS66 family insertion sequence element accessory protein TnpB n=1 Tax=Proteiniphilum sp. TaxID=1926877 RepID=UPI002B1EC493|nr:IS66 family insertion sequence element accessory protein TnpB [Proteiniphilum sp.]MEA5130229.1 IS66 family insertion sequence element accessory protein TnpB [Proteiniphilum sp.]